MLADGIRAWFCARNWDPNSALKLCESCSDKFCICCKSWSCLSWASCWSKASRLASSAFADRDGCILPLTKWGCPIEDSPTWEVRALPTESEDGWKAEISSVVNESACASEDSVSLPGKRWFGLSIRWDAPAPERPKVLTRGEYEMVWPLISSELVCWGGVCACTRLPSS